MKRCLVATAALAALASLALPAAPVFAHAGLESSTPGSSSVLEESPEAIVLDFDEAVEAPLTTIGLFDADARPIEVGVPVAVSGDDTIVQASLPELADGLYAVSWRITSVDGHVIDGAFSFQIGTAATGDADSLLGQVADGRLVLVKLTTQGKSLMETLFPAFNRQEIEVVSPVADNKRGDLADMLRAITANIEG
jgi:copper transport protein